MCGIFGIVAPAPVADTLVASIHRLQAHRGPDHKAEWRGRLGEFHLTLAAQRLSIIDLSPNGAQPFQSAASGSVIVFNGELYNYVELRDELRAAGIVFRTDSDTEVLLAALDHYGIEHALPKLNGMFAFAWLCGRSGRLWLARDRVGEKPLYYWSDGKTFAFASEIKALLAALPQGGVALNIRVVQNFLVNAMMDDGTGTFFEGILSLGPAQYGEIVPRSGGARLDTWNYWPPRAGLTENRHSLEENVERCRALVADAVRLRLRSDVPLGFLVSGGLDSSLVTAMAVGHGVDRDRVNAFSIVNPHLPDDETRWIDSVTRHLGIQVDKVTFDPGGDELLQLCEDHVYFHDEPFVDLSVIAHVEMMKAARNRGVTVLLSGGGGDELFCGYNKYFYFYVQSLMRQHRPLQALDLVWRFWRNGTVLRNFSAADAARYLPMALPGVARLPLGERLAQIARDDIGLQAGDVGSRQIADLLRFSAPAINHMEDRASMALSREVRSPLFDWRVMEFALSLPVDQKVGDGWTKRILRLAAEPSLPPEIVWRKDKVGHFTATREWLVRRGGDAIRSRLDRASPVFARGFLDADRLLPQWEAFWAAGPSRLTVGNVARILSLDTWLRVFGRSLRI